MRLHVALFCASASIIGGSRLLEGRDAGSAEATNSASWWIATYGVVESTDPLARRAADVFLRVAAAADKRSNRQPKLVLLRQPSRPQANALPDGSVVVTRSAVELCYRGGRDGSGDAKLAFVFGHELSHLASDDFWRGPAWFGVPQPVGERASSEQRSRESKADSHGIVYATLAGYDPRAVAKGSFLAEWIGRRAQDEPPSPGQIEPAQRLELVRSELASVTEELDVFRFGVRLVQLGRYADALVLLERFRTRFPGREVLNNVGLAHLQLALRFLAACDPSQYLRFKLPTILDPDTLASSTAGIGYVPQVRAPGAPRLNCTASGRFQAPWSEAVRSFRLARESDPSYVPAFVNLATALLVAGNGTEALNETNSALRLEPRSHAASLQRAVALYLLGSENDLDTDGAAIESLRQLQAADGTSADVAYDLARVLSERGRPAAASQAWRRFLALEPYGSYATEASRWLPEATPQPEARATAAWKLPEPPLALGSDVAAVEAQRATARVLREGSFRGTILRGALFSALAIDDVIEVVERPTQSTRSPLEAYGPALRVEGGSGADLYFYPGLMVEWSPGRSRIEVFYQATSRTSAHR